jgi:hypothetical protein
VAIKEKYSNPNRFRSVENLDSLFVTRIRTPEKENLPNNPNKVIIGDTPDIRTCTRMYHEQIVHNWPSQWHSRYPDGYIIFASGRKYDRKRRRINSEQAFTFFPTENIEIIFQKHVRKKKIIAGLEIASDEELRVVFELCCERAGQQLKRWWSRDSAERYIVSQLEAMSLQELGDLAALLEGPAGSASPESPSKAA